jgi:hypothetical protein
MKLDITAKINITNPLSRAYQVDTVALPLRARRSAAREPRSSLACVADGSLLLSMMGSFTAAPRKGVRGFYFPIRKA